MKQYRLKKDLPGMKAGVIFKWNTNDEVYEYINEIETYCYTQERINTETDWFEEIVEEIKEINLAKQVDDLVEEFIPLMSEGYLNGGKKIEVLDRDESIKLYNMIITELNGNWEADWNDANQFKYYMEYIPPNDFGIAETNMTQRLGIKAARSIEICEAMWKSKKFRLYLINIIER